MADEHDDERDRQNARLFGGTPARGSTFDSLDSLTWTEEPPRAPRPAPAAPPAAPPAGPIRGPEPEAEDPLDAEDELDLDDALEGRGSAGDGDDGTDTDDSDADAGLDDDAGPRRRGRGRPVPAVLVDAPPTIRRQILTAVAVLLAAAATFLLVFPFDVTAGSVTAECGPPVYEVLVPADEAFDVAENELCGPPARTRAILGVLLAVAFVAVAVAHPWSERATIRRARRARRARARAARRGGSRATTTGRGDAGAGAVPDADAASDADVDGDCVPAGPTAR